MKRRLSKLNGLYIPGNFRNLIEDRNGDIHYVKAVQRAIEWAQLHNEQENNHFPILGVGYGCLAMMRSQSDYKKFYTEFEARGRLQVNLAHKPEHTYLFDEYKLEELEQILDKISFFSDVEMGITMADFILQEKILSSIFMPVSSFDDSSLKSSNQEFVASIEGVVYPWFGIMYRIDRIQFGLESSFVDQTDHSREAIAHA